MTTSSAVQTNPEMQWVERPPDGDAGAPPLDSGDRLNRLEFEERYRAHPEIKKAELVEGVVYVASPVRLKQHSNPHLLLATWLGNYLAATPGVSGGDNGTVRLDPVNEPQPDLFLYLPPEHGGASRESEDDYLEGPPDLVVEVAASSASYDLGDKLRAYQRNGVREYVVPVMYERQVRWFVLQEGTFVEMAPDEDGVLRSKLFPGLWLKPETVWALDFVGILSVLQEGLGSPEHADFVARLQAKGMC